MLFEKGQMLTLGIGVFRAMPAMRKEELRASRILRKKRFIKCREKTKIRDSLGVQIENVFEFIGKPSFLMLCGNPFPLCIYELTYGKRFKVVPYVHLRTPEGYVVSYVPIPDGKVDCMLPSGSAEILFKEAEIGRRAHDRHELTQFVAIQTQAYLVRRHHD
jgi:hypothetical protein